MKERKIERPKEKGGKEEREKKNKQVEEKKVSIHKTMGRRSKSRNKHAVTVDNNPHSGKNVMTIVMDSSGMKIRASISKKHVIMSGTCSHTDCPMCSSESRTVSKTAARKAMRKVCKTPYCLPIDDDNCVISADMMVDVNMIEDKFLLLQAMEYIACMSETQKMDAYKIRHEGEMPDVMLYHLEHVHVDLVVKFKNSVPDHVAYDFAENVAHMIKYVDQDSDSEEVMLEVLATMPNKTLVHHISDKEKHKLFKGETLALLPQYSAMLTRRFMAHHMTPEQIKEAFILDRWLRKMSAVGFRVVLIQLHSERDETLFYINDPEHIDKFRTGKEKHVTPMVITKDRRLVCRRVQLSSVRMKEGTKSSLEENLVNNRLAAYYLLKENADALECSLDSLREARTECNTQKHPKNEDLVQSTYHRIFMKKLLATAFDTARIVCNSTCDCTSCIAAARKNNE